MEQGYYTHVNWGGEFCIIPTKDFHGLSCYRVTVQVTIYPFDWKVMRCLGWEDMMVFNIEDIKDYFKRVK